MNITGNRKSYDQFTVKKTSLDDHIENGGHGKYSIGSVKSNGGILDLYEGDVRDVKTFHKFIQSVQSYSATIPCSVDQPDETLLENQDKPAVTKLGTFMGVYLPCCQNILGIILFIRLSWIVGIAGVGESLAIVVVCCSCTLLTAVSMSAVATNGVVPSGGSYFMMSRSLGPEFGGAVGVLFYLGTSFASAMYILGAVEILLTYVAPEITIFDTQSTGADSMSFNNMRVYGTAFVILLGFIVFIGVKYVNKCALLFLACVLLSILSIFVGFFSIHARNSPNVCYVGTHLISSRSYSNCTKNDTKLVRTFKYSEYFNNSKVTSQRAIPGITSNVMSGNLQNRYLKAGEVVPGVLGGKGEVLADETTSFTFLLALFFPSVTGIMAGSNRSGNLKDAQNSIPKGTIGAIITTSIIYLASVLLYGSTVAGDVLRDKFGQSIAGSLIPSSLAWPTKWVILIGALMSTIGAGLQSLTGAPRLLQAIANDGVIPFLSIFSPLSKDGEPKRALLLTLLISEIGVIIASLDAVAPIITMFFLMCYGFVNFACVLQSLLRLPNWRPRFRFYHWSLSLLGVVLCLVLMFISSWYYALVAIIVAAFLYKYIEYRGAEKEWGDGLNGLALSAARVGLLRLEGFQEHTKNWRPQILVICEQSTSTTLSECSKKMLAFVGQLKHGRGLTIASCVYEGSILESSLEVDELKEELETQLKEQKVKGFCEAIAAPKFADGVSFLIQSCGLGKLRPNTVCISWPRAWKESLQCESFIQTIRITTEMKCALVVLKNTHLFPTRKCREEGTIDIWWIVHDGGLMLLMMFLLRQHKIWKKCKVRLFTVAQITDNSIKMRKDLTDLLYNLRLEAEVQVIEMEDSDISAYVYERTLHAEQRRQMVSKIGLTRRQSNREVQSIVDKTHIPRLEIDLTDFELVDSRSSKINITESETDNTLNDAPTPDQENVRRMDAAVKINKLVKEKSETSKLVMINLPRPPRSAGREIVYMDYIDALTEGLPRVVLIRGAGHEVVTIYS